MEDAAVDALAMIAEIETRLAQLTQMIHHADVVKRRKYGKMPI